MFISKIFSSFKRKYKLNNNRLISIVYLAVPIRKGILKIFLCPLVSRARDKIIRKYRKRHNIIDAIFQQYTSVKRDFLLMCVFKVNTESRIGIMNLQLLNT